MWLISRLHENRYCAFCKSPRRVYVKKHIDLTNVVYAIAFSVAISFSFWGEPDPRVLILSCLFLFSAELFVYLRWRMTLTCNLCGFDPVLYKRSPAQARNRVKGFYHEQMDNPEFMLSRSPLLKLQKQILLNKRKTFERDLNLKRAKASSLAQPKSL